MTIGEFLRDAGHAVLEAASAEDALAIIEDSGKIDVLVTDIQLHGSMTGWDLAEAMRDRDGDLPVIYASAYATPGERTLPGSLFFAKPYSVESLISACSRLAAERGAQRGAQG